MTTYLKGEARTAVRAQAKQLYEQGSTIRSVADQLGRSYSGTYALLVEAGVTFRAPGRSARKKAS